jgi:lysophospholipase L1-like esterase
MITSSKGKTSRNVRAVDNFPSFATMQWAAVALLLALLSGCGGKTPPLPRLGAGDVIVAFGDSLTYGTGAAENESYPAVLAQLTGRKVVRAGAPGEITAQALRRLPGVLSEHKPRLVIVCLGGNDMLRKVSEAETIANLRAIVRKVNDSGAHAVLVGVPRPALLTSAPKFYAEIAQEFGIPYEGAAVTSVLYKPEFKSDPIHPNAAGYRRIAEAIAGLLRRAGAV